MSDQVSPAPDAANAVAPPLVAAAWWWRADAAWRLGPRPLALFLRHRARLALGLPGRALARASLEWEAAEQGRFLPPVGMTKAGMTTAAPDAPILPTAQAARVLAAATALPTAIPGHGGFDASRPAMRLDLFAAGDIRPVWEAGRFAVPLLLAQAARIDPAGGHLDRAEAWIAGWVARNPPFLGPAWACGQEAALRALALSLALALLGAATQPPPSARALLRACARRIAATPDYAAAQDNNHSISEPAGAYAVALLLGDAAGTARQARSLGAAVSRLIAADGGFAQNSAGYARLALDVLATAEFLRRTLGAPAFPAVVTDRAAAVTCWLSRVTAEDGSSPRLGVEDGSAFADLGLHGPGDARGSLDRAARLFLDGPLPETPARWRSAGCIGWREGGATALLRGGHPEGGRLRFRPSQADLLHLTLRDGPLAVLRDGGTGAYNPPEPWWWAAIAGAAAHNAVVFDGAEPMPRAGRFLLAAWPRLRALPDGAEVRDRHRNRQQRRIAVAGRRWTIEDRIAGRFRDVALHWRLPPGEWRLLPDGVDSAAARISVSADAPLTLRLDQGWESPAYGMVAPAPVLVVTGRRPLSRITTVVTLPSNPGLIIS